MIILWDKNDHMTVWSSVANLHNELETALGLLEANHWMGEDVYVRATNDLGAEVILSELLEKLNEHTKRR
jgi:hypothetical protein